MVHEKWVSVLGPDPEGLFRQLDVEPGRVVRGGGGQGRTSVREVAGHRMFCKFYRPGRWSRRLRDIRGFRRAERELHACLRVEEAGVPCALIVAAIAVGFPWSMHHLLLTLPAEGRSLRELLDDPAATPASTGVALAQAADFIADMHYRGVFHNHLSTPHVFLDAHGRGMLIDLESARVEENLSREFRQLNIRQVCDDVLKSPNGQENVQRFRRLYNEAWARLREANGLAVEPDEISQSAVTARGR